VPQVLCWQLVLVALILAVGRPWPLVGAVVIVALVVVASTTLRFRGRWLYEWLVVASKYSLRDRDRDLRDAGEAGQALLRLVSPEAVGITDDVNDDPVFMVSRAAGITAVLQPKATGRDLTKAIPAPETLLPSPHEQAPGIAVQVVHHAGTSRERPPRVWVALQALRTAEVHRDSDLQRVLGNTIRRVRRQFRRGGLPARVLAEAEVLGALASLAHVTAGRIQVREEWRLWHSGPISQATFKLGGWAALSPAVAPQLVRRLLTAAPPAAVTIAVTAHRPAAATEPRIDATLRIATTDPPAVERAAHELAQLASAWGITLERLDGRHSWGMAATLPIGVAWSYRQD
jgi:type VII secretion protein EccE